MLAMLSFEQEQDRKPVFDMTEGSYKDEQQYIESFIFIFNLIDGKIVS